MSRAGLWFGRRPGGSYTPALHKQLLLGIGGSLSVWEIKQEESLGHLGSTFLTEQPSRLSKSFSFQVGRPQHAIP